MRILALALLLCSSARAATFTGADWGGASLRPANGDILSGTFTNVSDFVLAAGATVYVAPGVPFVVYAQTMTLAGTLDGIGRGEQGGSAGSASGPGQNGFGGSSAGAGGGSGGASGKGGGGGGHGGVGGQGAGGTSAGSAYGSTDTISVPLSADDAFKGSGGGGGGGNASKSGGAGAPGGASVYLEASSITITGAILVNGTTAAAVTDTAAGAHPAAGGGGSGGSIVIRAPLGLSLSGALSAAGGNGGEVVVPLVCGTVDPGGGGAAGRVKVFSLPSASFSVVISTPGGSAGGSGGFCGTMNVVPSTAGAPGTVKFGVLARAPSAFGVGAVHVTSIAWTWAATPDFGDGPTLQTYRIFPATASAPLAAPEATSAVVGTTVAGLAPNTTYYRFVTAYTDWGDSHPSNATTAYTLADAPALAAAPFTAAASESLSFAWTSGAAGNPAHTQYEVSRSSIPGFGVSVSTSFVVGLASATSGLQPNTSYYFRARALNLAGLPTEFTATAATATLAAVPATPAFGSVFVTSASLAWQAAGNPADTLYLVQTSSDNFFTIADSSRTLATSATFFALDPGRQYFFRVGAFNRHGLISAYSTVLSTTGGNVSDLTPPTIPGGPVADRQFSYDGAVLFAWTPAAHAVGILDYHLIVGTLPGAADVLNDFSSVFVASRALSGLASGRSYYAQVRARANNGVYSSFSGVSAGLPVFDTAVAGAISKPFSWPSPFDPRTGPAQIGFSMPEPGSVLIRIFTLQGRLVHEQRRDFGAGNQIATWSGENGAGARVAPGGYVVLIQKRLGGRVESQKMKLAVLY